MALTAERQMNRFGSLDYHNQEHCDMQNPMADYLTHLGDARKPGDDSLSEKGRNSCTS